MRHFLFSVQMRLPVHINSVYSWTTDYITNESTDFYRYPEGFCPFSSASLNFLHSAARLQGLPSQKVKAVKDLKRTRTRTTKMRCEHGATATAVTAVTAVTAATAVTERLGHSGHLAGAEPIAAAWS